MFAVFAFTVLCLVSVSHSTPLLCEKLVQPLESLAPHHLEGRWALVAGSLNHSQSMDALRLRDSITMYFSNSSDPSTVSYTQINRFGNGCQHLRYNISLDGSSFSFDVGNRFDLNGSFHYTSCPDCLVMLWVVKSSKRHSVDLYLLSRRREVDLREMEEFRAQLKCFQLPVPVVMDSAEKLCPERRSTTLEGSLLTGMCNCNLVFFHALV
uniref:Apolipoprotein M n=1 Tax=Poecilia reticulata TaxID=8081 RepID=A0A3P9PCK4_POERE